MNASDAEKQIQQLIAFIKQEAREKAEEIQVKTESEFMAEKLNLQTQASIAIREDFEKKKKDRIINRRIERSKVLTDARFATMRRRDQKMKELKKDVYAKLADVPSSKEYPALIKYLIAQALTRMQEDEVQVVCRKEDEKIVAEQLDAGKKLFQDTIQQATGIRPEVKLTLSTKESLPPGPSRSNEGLCSYGGVKLTARNGKIVCKNTLESRLELCFKELAPSIRGYLFGVRAAAVGKPSAEPAHH